MKNKLFLFTLALYFLFFVSEIQAQSAISLSAIPPRLDVSVKPGQTVTKQIKIRNDSSTTRFINTSSKDFIVTDDAGTPVRLDGLDDSTNRWAAASWIQISPGSFKLLPGETKILTVIVIAPENATPGGHYAMILHTPKNEATLSATGSFIETNVGTLLYITIPGAITEKATLTDFSAPFFSEYGPINFKATVNNLSDIHITPVGSIDVTNWFGGRTASLPLSPTNIFPGTSRHLETTLNRKWLFGRYTATFNSGYGSTGQALVSSLIFWVIPWRLILLLIAAAIMIGVIFYLIKNRPPSAKESTNQIEDLEKELSTLKKKYQDRK